MADPRDSRCAYIITTRRIGLLPRNRFTDSAPDLKQAHTRLALSEATVTGKLREISGSKSALARSAPQATGETAPAVL